MSENPFRTDEKLRQLLADVTSIPSGNAMSQWRVSFLKVYQEYLDPDGILNAKDAEGRLIRKLETLGEISLKIQKLAGQGHISKDQITAEGRRFLSKWTEQMRLVEGGVGEFCPKTAANEEQVGYDKYELGAIMVQDGFEAYDIMSTSRDFVVELKEGPLEGLIEPNALRIVNAYIDSIQAFCDIMADLGLWKAMKQCVQVYQDEGRPDPATQPEIVAGPPEDDDRVEVSKNHGRGPDGKGSGKGGKGNKKSGKGSAGKSKSGPSSKGMDKNKGNKDDEYFDYKDPEEVEEEEPPPPSEGEGGGGQKIIYFDPRSGAIGLLEREKCATESTLLLDKDGKTGELKNNGIVESKAEKDNLVWLLKKLEKKETPKEGAWLEQIKKEKAARGGASKSSSVRITKEGPDGKKKPLGRKSSTGGSSRGSGGFSNPLEMSSGSGKGSKSSSAPRPPTRKLSSRDSSSSKEGGGRRQRASVSDFNGLYKSSAPKPVNSGWEKVKPEEATGDE